MSLEVEQVRIDLLLPVQRCVDISTIAHIQGVTGLPPVELVPYGDEFILLDGTNRAYARYKDGDDHIDSVVARTDAETYELRSPVLSLAYCETLADIHRMYEELIRPKIIGSEVFGVADLTEEITLRSTRRLMGVD